jgi:hypothetical protein
MNPEIAQLQQLKGEGKEKNKSQEFGQRRSSGKYNSNDG